MRTSNFFSLNIRCDFSDWLGEWIKNTQFWWLVMCLGKDVSLFRMIYYCNNHSDFLHYYLWRRKKTKLQSVHMEEKMCLLINGKYSHIVFTKCTNIPVWNCWNAEKWKYERITDRQTIAIIGNKNVLRKFHMPWYSGNWLPNPLIYYTQ